MFRRYTILRELYTENIPKCSTSYYNNKTVMFIKVFSFNVVKKLSYFVVVFLCLQTST